MKIRIFVIAISVITLSSCSKDLLDTTPTDRLATELFWKTDNDAVLASNAVYTYLEGTTIFSWDGMSDMGHTNQSFATEALIERGQFDALNPKVLAEWTNYFKGIGAANSFLANVDKIVAQNTQLIEVLKAEVRTLRAYFYMRLVSIYGDIPIIEKEINLQESKELERAPAGKVWDFIAAELNQAAGILPAVVAQKGRITKGAALALNARSMLQAGRFAEAAQAAKAVMDLNVYSLYPSFGKLFTYEAENNSEVILDKQFIKDSYAHNVFASMAPYSQMSSQNTFVPTKQLVDAYQMTNGLGINDPASGFDPYNPYVNRDPRLRYSIFVSGDKLPDGKIFNAHPASGTADALGYSYITSVTGFTVKKYINVEDMQQPANSGINIILLRYAEILLIYAEAKIELNQLDQSVLDAINAVRKRTDVNMPVIAGSFSQQQLRNIVRQERTVELAFEGLRYFDIRRWKIAEFVMPGAVYGMTYNENGTLKTVEIAQEKTFQPNRDYVWPVPQKELDLNPGLGQNPNW